MRVKLKAYVDHRARFTATVGRFGTKPGWQGRSLRTILLTDIRNESGQIVTDHLWFQVGKRIDALNLQPGDRVNFKARADYYEAGYLGYRDDPDLPPPRRDLKLCFPTDLRKVDKEPPQGQRVLQ